MTRTKARLTIEIRQNSTDITTDDPDVTADNIVENTFPPKDLTGVTDIRVYLEDTHDVALDVEIDHTHSRDDDFSGETAQSTVSLTSGSDQGNVTMDGPIGKFRAKILASQASAVPTTGQITLEVIGTN